MSDYGGCGVHEEVEQIEDSKVCGTGGQGGRGPRWGREGDSYAIPGRKVLRAV
jgi:hypothetical protein